MNKLKEFFENVKKEFGKVTWPTQQELVENTTIVLVFAVIISLVILGMDTVFGRILDFIF